MNILLNRKVFLWAINLHLSKNTCFNPLFLYSPFLFHQADFKANYIFQTAISSEKLYNHPKWIDYTVYSLAIYQYSVSRRLDDVTKKVCKAVSTCRLQLSGLCQSVSSSQEVKCQKRSAICEMINMLFVIGIYHVPPAALVPVSGISGAGHLSAFLSAHQFLRAGSSIGAWIDQNLSMSLKIKWKYN